MLGPRHTSAWILTHIFLMYSQYPKNCLIRIHGEGTFGGKGTNIGRTPDLQDGVREAVAAMINEAGRKICELEALTHGGVECWGSL